MHRSIAVERVSVMCPVLLHHIYSGQIPICHFDLLRIAVNSLSTFSGTPEVGLHKGNYEAPIGEYEYLRRISASNGTTELRKTILRNCICSYQIRW